MQPLVHLSESLPHAAFDLQSSSRCTDVSVLDHFCCVKADSLDIFNSR